VRRLIIIEGMIGAGKSTTAEHLAAWLVGRGADARAFHECADDHPIRTSAVDLLRAANSDAGRVPAGAGDDDPAADPSVYNVTQWGALADRCARGEIIVLESTFLQNSVLPVFADDAPIARVEEAFARIAAQIAPADPLLVYLRPRDIVDAVGRVHAERGEPWSSRNLKAVSRLPWARRRGLVGRRAVIELYRAWEPIVDELLAGSPLASTIIVDPQRDWEDSMRRIVAAVSAPTASVPTVSRT
jgi:hypothetical protein